MKKIRVLVAEDSDDKFVDIEKALQSFHLPSRISVERAKDYENAYIALNEGYFDFLVLDLLIPVAGELDGTAGAHNLVELIESGSFKSNPFLIGLTGHREIFENEQEYFKDRLILLQLYDPDGSEWANRLFDALTRTISFRDSYLSFVSNFPVEPLVVFTARYENEFLPISQKIKWIGGKPKEVEGEVGMVTLSGVARIKTREQPLILICMGQMGLSAAAAMTAQIISHHRPLLLVMLGMCCGFRSSNSSRPSKLLDVIITRDAVCWDEGKYQDDKKKGIGGFSYRPVPATVSTEMASSVEKFCELNKSDFGKRAARLLESTKNDDWRSRLEGEYSTTPEIKFGLNVSGNCIVSSEEMVEEIVERNRSALSLEMEIYGVMRSVSLATGFCPEIVCMKGVADFGEEKQSGAYDPIQPIASVLSYFAFEELFPTIRGQVLNDAL